MYWLAILSSVIVRPLWVSKATRSSGELYFLGYVSVIVVYVKKNDPRFEHCKEAWGFWCCKCNHSFYIHQIDYQKKNIIPLLSNHSQLPSSLPTKLPLLPPSSPWRGCSRTPFGRRSRHSVFEETCPIALLWLHCLDFSHSSLLSGYHFHFKNRIIHRCTVFGFHLYQEVVGQLMPLCRCLLEEALRFLIVLRNSLS